MNNSDASGAPPQYLPSTVGPQSPGDLPPVSAPQAYSAPPPYYSSAPPQFPAPGQTHVSEPSQYPPPGAFQFVDTPQPYSPPLGQSAFTSNGPGPSSDPDVEAALQHVLSIGGSDLHIAVNSPPMIRVDGALEPIAGASVWDSHKVSSALNSLLTPAQRQKLDTELELDIAYTASSGARFRANFYRERNSLAAAFRFVPIEIKSLRELGVPDSIANFAQLTRGLVLVTGPTGSGKSTTLAAIIDLVNRSRADHIVTIEDPIEFLHSNHKSLVNQREVGHDTHGFAEALKHVLRQDPDVILVGELRDLETISVTLTAAETGHLVFATLHTQSAAQTIDRIIDVYPPHQQGQVRSQLASTLQGVVCQTLVKRAGGSGRVVATEVLVRTTAVANLIREGKTHQVPSAMQAGRALGMHTLDQHLAELVNSSQITLKAAREKAYDVEVLMQTITRYQEPGAATGQIPQPGYENGLRGQG